MISETEYQNNKEMLRWLKSEMDKAQGSFDQSMKTLKKEFKCKSLKEAEALIAKLKDEVQLYETQYKEAIKQVKRKYKKQLKLYRPN